MDVTREIKERLISKEEAQLKKHLIVKAIRNHEGVPYRG